MSVKLSVKVIPGSSRDQIAGWLGDSLKIKVSAPPEKGKANKSVQSLLARALGISPRSVQVVSGHTSPLKVLEITGIESREVFRLLKNYK